MGPAFDSANLKALVCSSPDKLPDEIDRAIFQKMCEAFRTDAHIHAFLETLSKRARRLCGATNSRIISGVGAHSSDASADAAPCKPRNQLGGAN